jgi:cytoskeletal protein RodZ
VLYLVTVLLLLIIFLPTTQYNVLVTLALAKFNNESTTDSTSANDSSNTNSINDSTTLSSTDSTSSSTSFTSTPSSPQIQLLQQILYLSGCGARASIII